MRRTRHRRIIPVRLVGYGLQCRGFRYRHRFRVRRPGRTCGCGSIGSVTDCSAIGSTGYRYGLRRRVNVAAGTECGRRCCVGY